MSAEEKTEKNAKGPKNKTDRRVMYTKMFLRDSLLELMKEKPVDKITPTELCRHAGINRNTFYSHYYTPEDVLYELEVEFSEQVFNSLGMNDAAVDTARIVSEICRIVYDRKDFCKILLSSNGDPSFLEKVIELCREMVYDEWKRLGVTAGKETMDMLFTYIVYGSMAVIRKWVVEDFQRPPAEIADIITQISFASIGLYRQ